VGENHSHHDHAHGNNAAAKNIFLALVLNLGFAVIELFGGLYTNSVAILSDALHDFGDAFSLGAAWYLQKISNRPRDHFYSYGYRRFSLLGALVVSAVLLVGVALVIRESIERLMHPAAANAKGMFVLAIVGIAVNGFAALRVKRGHSHNERAVYLHLLEDVLGWIAVLISSIFMIYFNLPFLDPLISLAISVYILANVFRNVRGVVKILLMEVPNHIHLGELEKSIRAMKHVAAIDDLHLWTLDGESHVLTLQVIVSEKITFKELKKIKQKIRSLAEAQSIRHSTIEFCTAKEERVQAH